MNFSIPEGYIFVLPKRHLSSSAMDLWESNKEGFRTQYYLNGKKAIDNQYTRFGSKIATAIEEGKKDELFPDLHVYPLIEHKLYVMIRGVYVLAYLDSYGEDENLFDEYKTGKLDKKGNPPWDQAKVQKRKQLVVYATLLRAITGEMPAYCDLHWLETRFNAKESHSFFQDAKELMLTGKIVTFRRYFDIRELEKMEDRIEKIAYEISEDYQKFISEL